ncbi:MAG: imidazole glycerol phosphate synthase subunit HisH [Actinobacteria bacterium]|nr:imidazole glycerol phosphate synthase subunit HisH [Actinomycetota bacterium]
MTNKIAVIDYGIGNVSSVLRAFKYLGVAANLCSNPKEIINSDRVVLPGDGAFGDSMGQLKKRELFFVIERFINSGKPFLGICVGMQVLATQSFEFGKHLGLNIIPSEVIKFPIDPANNYKIPQIGWNKISKPLCLKSWQGTVFEDLHDQDWVYFIHSFYVNIKNTKNILSETTYGKVKYASAIIKDNVIGCQFHPEKSGITGLKILNKFLKIN